MFPDIDGIAAMGETLVEAVLNGAAVLQDYAIEMERDGLKLAPPSSLEDTEVPEGCVLTSIVFVRAAPDKPGVRLNITLDAGIAEFIASESKRRGMSRKNFLERLVRQTAQVGG
ncbi:MAG: type II toxin-antitoxin system HicB family antitoxin [Caldilineaceae bacterium]|nr:type II toxin-antitoxin system HicB family antitoxin [Caldilineaceae bacterium]